MKILDLIEQDDEFAKQTYGASNTTDERLDALQREMKTLAFHYKHVRDALQPYVNAHIFIDEWTGAYKQLVDVTPYKGVRTRVTNLEWMKVSRGVKEEPFVIDPKTPNIEKFWTKIENLTNTMVKYAKMYFAALKEQQKLKKKQREEVKSQSANDTSSLPAASKEEIKKIASEKAHIVIGKRSMTNPVTYCAGNFYAGPPEKYKDLTSTQWDLYIEIQKALKDAGWAPLTTLYGGRTQRNFINFVAVNDDNTFAWRKYQTSAQGGQNVVYIKDVGKITTAAFTYNPKKYLTK